MTTSARLIKSESASGLFESSTAVVTFDLPSEREESRADWSLANEDMSLYMSGLHYL